MVVALGKSRGMMPIVALVITITQKCKQNKRMKKLQEKKEQQNVFDQQVNAKIKAIQDGVQFQFYLCRAIFPTCSLQGKNLRERILGKKLTSQ